MLPYCEEQAIHDAFVPTERVDADVNERAMRTPVAIMYCPTLRAPAADRDFDNNQNPPPPQSRGVAAGGDFSGAAGVEARYGLNGEAPIPPSLIDPKVAGPLFTISQIKLRRVKDGLGKTLAVGERYIRPFPQGSMQHILQGDTAFFAGDNWRTNLSGSLGGLAVRRNDPSEGKFGSEHAEIVQFVLLDGRILSMGKGVDEATLRALSTIADGGIVSVDLQFESTNASTAVPL